MRGPVVKGPELYLLITSPLIVCLYSHAMKRFTHERERERSSAGWSGLNSRQRCPSAGSWSSKHRQGGGSPQISPLVVKPFHRSRTTPSSFWACRCVSTRIMRKQGFPFRVTFNGCLRRSTQLPSLTSRSYASSGTESAPDCRGH